MMKRIVSVIIIFVVVTGVLKNTVLTVFADNSGKCGEDAYYYFDDDGVLTISGSGAMYDYYYSTDAVTSKRPPWYKQLKQINKVVIQDGITDVGQYAFYNCRNLFEIVIGNDVTNLDDYSFTGCNNLLQLELNDHIEYIGSKTFSGCSSLVNGYFSGNP